MAVKRSFQFIFISILFLLLPSCHASKTGIPPVTSQPTKPQTIVTEPISSSTITDQPTMAPTTTGSTPSVNTSPWWTDAIFYEIFVRSFYDSNGDGIGDFNGIIEKLDYLNDGDPQTRSDLGITAIWLMPVNPASSYHGYDVTDYYSVNPDYGTLDEFKNLLAECHRRGIHVITDLVLNHTSVAHPWFIEARDDPQSAHRDWYIWAEKNPGYLGPWDEQVWYPTITGYYYAIFWSGMPDLNYKNDEVTQEMYKVTRFWLEEIGVDGFRLDAARHLIELDKIQADTQITHQWWEKFRTFYKEINPQAFTVGEVWTSNSDVVDYVKGDEFDMAFNFDLAGQIMRAIGSWNAKILVAALQSSYDQFSPGTYATFLTNHDQNRVMSSFAEDQDKARLAASILLTTPGTPFIYYGEEIGMTGSKPDENIRTPMLWSVANNAGFSTTLPWEDINKNYQQFNVAAEASDPDSLLSLYRMLIRLRNEHSALRVGEYYAVRTDDRFLLPFLRVSKDKETLLVLINISKKVVNDYELTLKQGPLSGSFHVSPLLGDGNYPDLDANSNGGFDSYTPGVEIPAVGLVILQLDQR